METWGSGRQSLTRGPLPEGERLEHEVRNVTDLILTSVQHDQTVYTAERDVGC